MLVAEVMSIEMKAGKKKPRLAWQFSVPECGEKVRPNNPAKSRCLYMQIVLTPSI
jgi:hypothetical protein